MNKVILVGRLTRDPDVRYGGANNTAVARFTLAVDRNKRREDGEQEADFISCVAFGTTAETIEKYVVKGTKLVIEGHIQTGSYTNKDGVKVYTTDVVVDRMEFAESKRNDAAPAPVADADGFMHIPDGIDEELPFN